MPKSKKIQTDRIQPETIETQPAEIPNNTLQYFNENVVYDLPPPAEQTFAPHPYENQIKFWQRDAYGFLPNVEYKFREDNRIDWRAMLPTKYLVPNKDKFPEGTDIKSLKIEELKDNQLLVLLNGFRHLLNIRGYLSLEQNISFATPDFASATCKLTLLPNYETNMQPLVFVGEGDSNQFNTHSWARNFPTCIAANRAFVRAARNALNIEILGSDEVGPNIKEQENQREKSINSSITSPISTLKSKLKAKNVSFGSFKKLMIGRNFVDESFDNLDNFPKEHVFEAIAIVTKAIEELEKKKAAVVTS